MADILPRVHNTLSQMQKNLECSICLELLQDPVLTKCEHHFCNFCVLALLQSKKKGSAPCPLCKEPVTKRGLIKHDALTNIVDAFRNMVTAVEDDTGHKCTPPRGPVRFSQPEPPSQRRRCLPKRAEKKSNVRRGKSRSVPAIPIHLDEKEEDDAQVQSSNQSGTFKSNINIRSSFPSTNKSKKRPQDKKSNKGIGNASDNICVDPTLILEVLANGSLGEVGDESEKILFNGTEDGNVKAASLQEKLERAKSSPLDPYEFIASQRTPRKIKKKHVKGKKKKPWEYSFGKISRKRVDPEESGMQKRERSETESDDDEEDSSLIHREDIQEGEGEEIEREDGKGGPKEEIEDDKEKESQSRIIMVDEDDDMVWCMDGVEENEGKNEIHEEENEVVRKDCRGVVENGFDGSKDEEVIVANIVEATDSGKTCGGEATEKETVGVNDKGLLKGKKTRRSREAAMKAMEAIKVQRHSQNSGESMPNSSSSNPTDVSEVSCDIDESVGHNKLHIFQETQEPQDDDVRKKKPLDVRLVSRPSSPACIQQGMPLSQPPKLNRNHGNKLFAKTYGRSKSKSPPQRGTKPDKLGNKTTLLDDLPDVTRIAEDEEGDVGEEVHLEDLGLVDPENEVTRHMEKSEGMQTSDVIDLTFEAEGEDDPVAKPVSFKSTDAEPEKSESGPPQEVKEPNGSKISGMSGKEVSVSEVMVTEGGQEQIGGGVDDGEGSLTGSGKKRQTLKERMRDKEGLTLSEMNDSPKQDPNEHIQSDWELALKLAQEFGSVPPNVEVSSSGKDLRDVKGRGKGRGRRRVQLDIENVPEASTRKTRSKRGGGKSGLASSKEREDLDVEISSFNEDSKHNSVSERKDKGQEDEGKRRRRKSGGQGRGCDDTPDSDGEGRIKNVPETPFMQTKLIDTSVAYNNDAGKSDRPTSEDGKRCTEGISAESECEMGGKVENVEGEDGSKMGGMSGKGKRKSQTKKDLKKKMEKNIKENLQKKETQAQEEICGGKSSRNARRRNLQAVQDVEQVINEKVQVEDEEEHVIDEEEQVEVPSNGKHSTRNNKGSVPLDESQETVKDAVDTDEVKVRGGEAPPSSKMGNVTPGDERENVTESKSGRAMEEGANEEKRFKELEKNEIDERKGRRKSSRLSKSQEGRVSLENKAGSEGQKSSPQNYSNVDGGDSKEGKSGGRESINEQNEGKRRSTRLSGSLKKSQRTEIANTGRKTSRRIILDDDQNICTEDKNEVDDDTGGKQRSSRLSRSVRSQDQESLEQQNKATKEGETKLEPVSADFGLADEADGSSRRLSGRKGDGESSEGNVTGTEYVKPFSPLKLTSSESVTESIELDDTNPVYAGEGSGGYSESTNSSRRKTRKSQERNKTEESVSSFQSNDDRVGGGGEDGARRSHRTPKYSNAADESRKTAEVLDENGESVTERTKDCSKGKREEILVIEDDHDDDVVVNSARGQSNTCGNTSLPEDSQRSSRRLRSRSAGKNELNAGEMQARKGKAEGKMSAKKKGFHSVETSSCTREENETSVGNEKEVGKQDTLSGKSRSRLKSPGGREDLSHESEDVHCDGVFKAGSVPRRSLRSRNKDTELKAEEKMGSSRHEKRGANEDMNKRDEYADELSAEMNSEEQILNVEDDSINCVASQEKRNAEQNSPDIFTMHLENDEVTGICSLDDYSRIGESQGKKSMENGDGELGDTPKSGKRRKKKRKTFSFGNEVKVEVDREQLDGSPVVGMAIENKQKNDGKGMEGGPDGVLQMRTEEGESEDQYVPATMGASESPEDLLEIPLPRHHFRWRKKNKSKAAPGDKECLVVGSLSQKKRGKRANSGGDDISDTGRKRFCQEEEESQKTGRQEYVDECSRFSPTPPTVGKTSKSSSKKRRSKRVTRKQSEEDGDGEESLVENFQKIQSGKSKSGGTQSEVPMSLGSPSISLLQGVDILEDGPENEDVCDIEDEEETGKEKDEDELEVVEDEAEKIGGDEDVRDDDVQKVANESDKEDDIIDCHTDGEESEDGEMEEAEKLTDASSKERRKEKIQDFKEGQKSDLEIANVEDTALENEPVQPADDDVEEVDGEQPLFDDECISQDSSVGRHNLTSASSVLSSQSDLMNSQQQENAKETLMKMEREIAEMERALKDGGETDEREGGKVDIAAVSDTDGESEDGCHDNGELEKEEVADEDSAEDEVTGVRVSTRKDREVGKTRDRSGNYGRKGKKEKVIEVDSDDGDADDKCDARQRKVEEIGRRQSLGRDENGRQRACREDDIEERNLKVTSEERVGPKTSERVYESEVTSKDGDELIDIDDEEEDGVDKAKPKRKKALGESSNGSKARKARNGKLDKSLKRSLGKYSGYKNVDDIEDEDIAQNVKQNLNEMEAAENSFNSLLKVLSEKRRKSQMSLEGERAEKEDDDEEENEKVASLTPPQVRSSPASPRSPSPRSPSPPPVLSQRTLLKRVSPLSTSIEVVDKVAKSVSKRTPSHQRPSGSQKKRRRVVVEESDSASEDDTNLEEDVRKVLKMGSQESENGRGMTVEHGEPLNVNESVPGEVSTGIDRETTKRYSKSENRPEVTIKAPQEKAREEKESLQTAQTSSAGSNVEPRKKRRKGESMSLIASGLNKQKLKMVSQLCKKAGCRFSGTFSMDTTHVIVNADDNLSCERTLKYFQGIAAGKWVISSQWVHDSLSASRLLPQEKYEIRGDSVNGRNHCGPMRSRLWKGPPLLGEYNFFCLEPYTGLSKDQLEGLLMSSGGSVYSHLSELPRDGNEKESLIIAQSGAQETDDDYNALYQKYQIKIISREWVLDSIAIFTAQPIATYLLCDVAEDDNLDELESDDEF
ncbi:uncharacterized protein [Apostichopus japonicus]|uniref:uncharacterized protein n=1 Tax=Stichopus japonicus TaxID=307972 RepID=UPI003AB680AC